MKIRLVLKNTISFHYPDDIKEEWNRKKLLHDNESSSDDEESHSDDENNHPGDYYHKLSDYDRNILKLSCLQI